LRCGKLARQFGFSGIILIILRRIRLGYRLIFIAVSLLLLRSKLASQLILLHFIRVIIFCISHFFVLLTVLRRNLDAKRGRRQFTTGRHTNTVRTRQLWANTLFNLRAGRSARGKTKDRRSSDGCRSC
jgi:hypothetical protein